MSFIFKLYINYNELIVFSIPAFAPGACKWTSTEIFFMSKIQKLPTFLG